MLVGDAHRRHFQHFLQLLYPHYFLEMVKYMKYYQLQNLLWSNFLHRLNPQNLHFDLVKYQYYRRRRRQDWSYQQQEVRHPHHRHRLPPVNPQR